MRIAISGTPGSGKTTIAKLLAKKLGYKYYSIGAIRRKMARQLGLTIEELNELGKKKEFTDKLADEFILKQSSNDNIIMEGRMAPLLLKKSLKIWLTTSEDIAKKRISRDGIRIKDKEIEPLKRFEQDIERLKELYGVDISDVKFDLSIDTSDLLLEEVLEKILKYLKRYGIVVE